jgi:hypothetical protein
MRRGSLQPIQHARHQILPGAQNQPAIPGGKGRNARRLRVLVHVERCSRLGALLKFSPRLPQRSVLYVLLIEARDVDELEIANVVKPQATFLACDLFEQAAVGWNPRCGREFVLRLRKPPEETRCAEGRMVVAAEPGAFLFRGILILQERAEVFGLQVKQCSLWQQAR